MLTFIPDSLTMNRSKEPIIVERNRLELPSATFVSYDKYIMQITYKTDPEEIDLKAAKKHTAAIKELCTGEGCHVILDFRNSTASFTDEARNWFACSEEHSLIRLSQAILVKPLAHKIVANFYINFNRPNCPVKIFEKEHRAIQWTQSLLV
jgi:hypothetical protein